MRTWLVTICPRCNFQTSSEGLSLEEMQKIGAAHKCIDGVATQMLEPFVRKVYGPGERSGPRPEHVREIPKRRLHIMRKRCES